LRWSRMSCCQRSQAPGLMLPGDFTQHYMMSPLSSLSSGALSTTSRGSTATPSSNTSSASMLPATKALAASVAVVAPGAGTGMNSSVYAELKEDPRFQVEFVGQSRAAYDCYPPVWPHGCSAPNLLSFAEEVYQLGWAHLSDLFVFGSRGGQVVLPRLWQQMGNRMPPSVVINGGCAMNLPERIYWPEAAVTFLLIGGQDNFRGNLSVEEYIAETRSWVPAANSKTAILYVNEMHHMPQAALLRVVLPMMLCALQTWRGAFGAQPKEEFRQIVACLNAEGWSGRLLYTRQPGEWAPDLNFGTLQIPRGFSCEAEDAMVAAAAILHSIRGGSLVELTKEAELKELFKAAANASKPSGNVPPKPSSGDRFYEVTQAAMQQKAHNYSNPSSPSQRSRPGRQVSPRLAARSPVTARRGTPRLGSRATIGTVGPTSASATEGLQGRQAGNFRWSVTTREATPRSPSCRSVGSTPTGGASPLVVPRAGRSPGPARNACYGSLVRETSQQGLRRAVSPNFGSLSNDYYPPPLFSEPQPMTASARARVTMVR